MLILLAYRNADSFESFLGRQANTIWFVWFSFCSHSRNFNANRTTSNDEQTGPTITNKKKKKQNHKRKTNHQHMIIQANILWRWRFRIRPRWHRLCKSKAQVRITESESIQGDRIPIAFIDSARVNQTKRIQRAVSTSETKSCRNAIYNICHRIYFAALAFIKLSGDGARKRSSATTPSFQSLFD